MKLKKLRRLLWMKLWEISMEESLCFHIGEEYKSVQEGTFLVPNSCSHLSIICTLKSNYMFLLFVMIKDPRKNIRLLKQMAYAENVIQLGENAMDTSIGGIPGLIMEGKWTLQIYIFREYIQYLDPGIDIPFDLVVSNDKKEITQGILGDLWVENSFIYENYDYCKIYNKQHRWYQGDLHTHTRLSDGKEMPYDANQKSEVMELDYYVPTEHNVMHTGWPNTPIMVVPGIEITTILGHGNIFGLTRIPKGIEGILSHKDPNQLRKDLEDILDECKQENWLFSINHPFLHIWKWLFDELRIEKFNCLEIINDPTYESVTLAKAKEANEKAVLLSDMLWEDGYRICAIGGSDSHNLIDEFYEGASEPSIPGDPMTSLYMQGLSPDNFKKALKQCKAYVTRYCKITSNIEFGKILPEHMMGFKYELILSNLEFEPSIFYIHNGVKHTCQIEKIEEGYMVKGWISLTNSIYQWIRFGAEDSEGGFLFYGNPITKGKKIPNYTTFGEIRKKLEERWRSKEYYLIKTEH